MVFFLLSFLFSLSSFSYVTHGNLTYITNNAKETQDARINLINKAEKIILFSPNYCGGQLCLDTITAIRDRLIEKEKLKAFLILSGDFLTDEEKRLLETVEKETLMDKNGQKYQRFFCVITKRHTFMEGFNISDQENHAKILVVDNIAIIGGSSVSDRMSSVGLEAGEVFEAQESQLFNLEKLTAKQYRDMDSVVSGPIVPLIKSYYYRLFTKWYQKEGLTDLLNSFPTIERIMKINTSAITTTLPEIIPLEEVDNIFPDVSLLLLDGLKEKKGGVDKILFILEKLLQEAQKGVTFAHMNISLPESLRTLLLKKKRDRPDFIIETISNGLFEDMPTAANFFIHINRSNYDLVNNIFEYQVADTLYHKKVTVIDDIYTIIGSYNFTLKSSQNDDEIALLIASPLIANRVKQILEIDKEHSRKIEAQEKWEILESSKTKILKAVQNGIFGNFL